MSVGRKPRPAAAQIAAGDPRKLGAKKLRAKLDNEPKASRGLPDCPAHLAGHEREAWEFWAPELAVMNLDSRPDAMMLEGACVAYGRAIEADAFVRDKGVIILQAVTNKEGDLVGEKSIRNPAIAISTAAWAAMKSFCAEFGLSPASRTRLSLEKKDSSEADLMDVLMMPRIQRVK